MSWWMRQRLGGVLLVYFLNVIIANSVSNPTFTYDAQEIYANASTTRSTLWRSLMHNCKNASLFCIQKNVYSHMNHFLDHTTNYQVDGLFKLCKNNLSYEHPIYNEIPDDSQEIAREDPFSKLTNVLGAKIKKFLATHDMSLQLPDLLFNGATLQIAPREFEGAGVLTKLELVPKSPDTPPQTPRIFFRRIKKIIGEKLMNALLAIILVISLLAIKFLFFMPLLMGVAAAKKLLLKLLLFFFPFLSFIFKLCPYVEPQGLTKFHHHHHQIAHLHHLPPHSPHLRHSLPPKLHHLEHEHDSGPGYDMALEYYSDGPLFGNEFVAHRKKESTLSTAAEKNDLNAWGLLQNAQGPKRIHTPHVNTVLTPAEIEALALKAEKEAVLKVRLQQEHSRVLAENKLLQEQILQSMRLQEKLKQQALLLHQRQRLTTAAILEGSTTPNTLLGMASNQILRVVPNKAAKQTTSLTQESVAESADPFYSPILEKVDKIMSGIGFTEEPCRERLICSMYKNPQKFSPYSNLISTQLSREATELQKPTFTNSAVIRFYRYVQAARDGQDKRECLRLYPSCIINTEL